MQSINMFMLCFAFCFYALSFAKNYTALGSDPGGIDLLTHLSNASVPQRYLGMGLCGQPFNYTEELLPSHRCPCLRLCRQLIKHQLTLGFSFFLEISRDMTSIVFIVFVLTRCFRSRQHRNCMTRRRTNLGSHIWTRRKIFWRHAGVSRDTYIARASKNLKKLATGCNENKLGTPFGTYSASCSKISKSLCGKINACSTAATTISGKQKRIQFCKRLCYTVRLLPFIFILTLLSFASVPQRHLGVGLCGEPFNHTEKLLPGQRCMCLRLCCQSEDPLWLEMGHEYPSDKQGDGPHSSEETIQKFTIS